MTRNKTPAARVAAFVERYKEVYIEQFGTVYTIGDGKGADIVLTVDDLQALVEDGRMLDWMESRARHEFNVTPEFTSVRDSIKLGMAEQGVKL